MQGNGIRFFCISHGYLRYHAVFQTIPYGGLPAARQSALYVMPCAAKNKQYFPPYEAIISIFCTNVYLFLLFFLTFCRNIIQTVHWAGQLPAIPDYCFHFLAFLYQRCLTARQSFPCGETYDSLPFSAGLLWLGGFCFPRPGWIPSQYCLYFPAWLGFLTIRPSLPGLYGYTGNTARLPHPASASKL